MEESKRDGTATSGAPPTVGSFWRSHVDTRVYQFEERLIAGGLKFRLVPTNEHVAVTYERFHGEFVPYDGTSEGLARFAASGAAPGFLASELLTLRAAITRLTAEKEQLRSEREAMRLRGYRQARIFEPSMDGYAGAMAVFNACFPNDPLVDGVAGLHISDLAARMKEQP